MSNRPDKCDSLHIINLALDVVSIAARLLCALHLFSGSRGSYTYILFNELIWNYEFIITKIYFH